MPYGLNESDVHDVLNVFQVTGLDKDGRYFMYISPSLALLVNSLTECREPCPAKAGDYWEFFAEIDVLCAVSTCPGGDLSTWGWGEGEEGGETDMLSCCRPLAVEIYSLKDEDTVLKSWKGPEQSAYKGMHGYNQPVFTNDS